jgi:acetoin utilization deacetylase AcuC-like enzyme
LRETLAAERLFRFEPAPRADPQILSLAHDPDYVQRFLEGTLAPAEVRRIGFPWSPGLVERTLHSAGGTLAASADALDSGFGGALAGGTHHASRSAGSGFCVFNDIAAAILWLRERAKIARAAVVDLDVHQGDGTAEIFASDPAVFTLSIHARNNFPFRKHPGTLDIALADGTGDEEYLAALAGALPRVFDFAPGVVFYQAGVDALAADRLGRLALSHAGLAERDRMVLEACRSRGIPVAITLGGGYCEPVEPTVEAHANTFRTAARVFGP